MLRATAMTSTFTAKLSRASTTATYGTARVLSAWLDTATRAKDVGPIDDGPGSCVIRLRADLVYDTREQALPKGIRAVLEEGNRRLLYAADEIEVLLRIATTTNADRFEVVGQVLNEGIPTPGMPVRLPGEATHATTDRGGTFRLVELPAGPCALEIHLNSVVLDVAPFDLT